MAYDMTGPLIEIFEEQQVSEKFRKREFVVELQGQYPEHIKFQLVQDKCALLDNYQIGDEVKVTFALRGRGFNKNGQMIYFTNLEAWRVEPAGNTPNRSQQRPAAQNPAPRAQPAAAPIASDDDNDLPF
ncbi:DUF3127 domain-containing protein [Hymenobacter sp. ASUV-10]|uniref:DUF3127 domain-containing protein n=1 Tax=Hymenobacter aranciens TaxID=3063996 RepID=A0ABT9B9G2_9BACT|nr:DUF3127 domain-containing protein [Hymenobacter sp. ASUV-10]MDO7873672.1 DUF3127 domain-containing protein [Hymenobacter sp. ASUV-10]